MTLPLTHAEGALSFHKKTLFPLRQMLEYSQLRLCVLTYSKAKDGKTHFSHLFTNIVISQISSINCILSKLHKLMKIPNPPSIVTADFLGILLKEEATLSLSMRRICIGNCLDWTITCVNDIKSFALQLCGLHLFHWSSK